MTTENDILSNYLQSLYGIEPLSVKEEHDLAVLIQEGDEIALDKLILHNLRFVVYVVRKMTAWAHGKVPVEDMIGLGNEALFQAALRWKPTNNAKFATYAKSFIEKGVRRELDNTANIIRLPINITEMIKRMNYNSRVLSQILGRKPKVKEIAKIMNISEAKINQLQSYILREPVSIENLDQERTGDDHED
jgi:DNA-directed RNA polymerase sigma subunit (sigma70/sigma32)